MGVTVHRGDCLEVLATLPSASVDAAIIDPPFFLPAQHYAARRIWPRSLSDLSVLEHFYRDVFSALRRVIKRPGHLICFCDAQSYPVFFTVSYPHFHNSACLIWDKGRIGLGGRSWRNQHELMLACYDPGAEVGEHAATIFRHAAVPSAERVHPAQKPASLLQELVRAVVPRDGTVLDCFAGSGSLGPSAVAEGRHAVLIERDPAMLSEVA